MADDEGYWEISGPRKYLNIPTVVPDYWCAKLAFHFPSKRPTVTGWGATMGEAMMNAKHLARSAEPAAE